jgi:hypothetical protein
VTKKQRAEVVELLRCAADYVADDGWDPGGALSVAAAQVGHERDYFKFAMDVERRVCCDLSIPWPGPSDRRIETLLEAAARVEEGSYP